MKSIEEFKNKIIQGDCLEVMKQMPDKSVDLVLTDPPYGMNYQSAWRTVTPQYDKIANDDNTDWILPAISEIYRVLKDDSHAYIFCNDYAISHFRDALEKVGFTSKRTLVWVKNNHTSGDLEGDYANKTEFILFVHKGRRELNGNRDTNVLNFNRVLSELHPTQKPVDLYQYLITKSSEEGEVVLDPFAGSCTLAVACSALHRDFICIEKEPQYVKICHDRIGALTQTMF